MRAFGLGVRLLLITVASLPASAQLTKLKKQQASKTTVKKRAGEKPVKRQTLCGGDVWVEFPANAFTDRTVKVQVLIDEIGSVVSANVVWGAPHLRSKAVELALKTKFTPKLLSGQPVMITAEINYRFDNSPVDHTQHNN
jgi:hypothetical protein